MPTYVDRGVWDPNRVYLGAWLDDAQTQPRPGGGDFVWYQGARWFASYYNSAINPMQDNPDVGDPNGAGAWIRDTSGPAIVYKAVAPEAPLGLTAGYISDDVVTLFWNPAEVKGVGDVTSYNVYKDGVKVGVSTTTSFAVKGLAADTDYTFTLKAINPTGASVSTVAFSAGTDADQIENGRYYSPFVDMTLPSTNIVDLARDSNLKDLTLAFMQTSNEDLDSKGNLKDGAVPDLAWGGITNTTLATGVIINQVKQLEAAGGEMTIAFGGYNGREAAVIAAQYSVDLQEPAHGGFSKAVADGKAVSHLAAQYQAVIDTYGIDHIDFDIENAVFKNDEAEKYSVVDDAVANHMRNLAINKLKAANPNLHVTFTVATMPDGVSTEPSKVVGGTLSGSGDVEAMLALAKADGVDIDVVNIMAMDYFDGQAANPDMGDNAISAAKAMHATLMALGIDAKVGITPMLGQNDAYDSATVGNEVFTLDDALDLEEFFASTPWVAGIGAWQLPRDRAATTDTTGNPPVSNGTGLVQADFEFSSILSKIGLWRATGGRGDDVIDGTDASDTLSGNAGFDTLSGKGGIDTLNGGANDDILDGGTGIDTASGGTGNDTFFVDTAADTVIELSGEGTADRVKASASYVLKSGVYVEVLTTTLDTGTTAINLTGNALKQDITGNAGANELSDGGAGAADVMRGLGGNDTYRVFNTGDTIVEGATAGTDDKVVAAVSYALGTGVYVEMMQTSSGAGTSAINLYGNEFAQSMIAGNNGANKLEGKGGADTLRGLGGADTFVFGTKLGGGNIDTIVDFKPIDDRFLLSDAIFTKLTPGTITADQFRANTTGEARDSTDRIIYDKDSGGIFYDADGLGGAAGVQFATVGLNLAITNADFDVV